MKRAEQDVPVLHRASAAVAWLGLIASLSTGCVPDGSLGAGGAGATSLAEATEVEGCEVGSVRAVADDDDRQLTAYVRGSDGAILFAHFDAGRDVPPAPGPTGGDAPPETCDVTGALSPAGFDLQDRELSVACGGVALAPERVDVVGDWASAWARAGACEGPSWIWLWTPRTCDQLFRRLPGAGTGEHALAPYVAMPRRRARAYCDLDDPDGGWTRIAWIEGNDAAIDAMDLTPRRDLVDGLELAARGVGSASPEHLAQLPPANRSFQFRFRCVKSTVATVDAAAPRLVLTTQSSQVARAIIAVSDVVRRPPAPLSATWSEAAGVDGMLGRPSLWGDVEAPAEGLWPEVGCDGCVERQWAGRWHLGMNPLLDEPMFIRRSSLPEARTEHQRDIAWRVVPGAHLCNDRDNSLNLPDEVGRWTVDFR